MRIGQTSAVHFLSRVATSVLGFLATVYLARVLGKEILGTYFLLIAVLAWLKIVGVLGIPLALTKRLSETEHQDRFLTAGLLVQTGTLLVTVVGVVLARPYVNDYLGFAGTKYVVALLFVTLFFTFVRGVLRGQHKVHVAALLQPLNRGLRTAFQVGAVFLGYGLAGLFAGYAVAGVITIAAGSWFVSASLARPTGQEVRSILSYVRYSWLDTLSSRTIDAMDTLVLGYFVTKGQIGIYEISWNLATLLAVFSISIAQSLFPEISKLSAEGDTERVEGLLEDALSFTGLLLIPGLVGGILVGDRVLAIYGRDFTAGATVLVVLIVSRMVYAYARQFTNTLNAVDRPDDAFRINAAFVASNMVLNLVLVWQFGWLGAATATATSAGVALVVGYATIRRHLDPAIPFGEMGRQWVAAGAMAGAVYGGLQVVPGTIPATFVVVFGGAGVYGLTLLGISPRFRTVVLDNLPGFVDVV